MELKLGAVVEYFFWSLLFGFALAFLYDFLRSLRRVFKTSVWGVNAEDIAFFILTAFLMFWIAYDKNNGQIRIQGFLGVFIGFFVYRLLFRDRLVRFFVTLLHLYFKMFFFIVKILLFPARVLYRLLARPFLVIGWYSHYGLNQAERISRTLVRRQKMLKKARRNRGKFSQEKRK